MLVDLHGCLPITKVVFLPLSLPSRCSASGNRLVFSRISTQTNITMQVLPCGEALHGFDFASTSLEGTLIGVVYSVRSFRLLSLETSLDPKTLTLGPLLLVEDIIRSSKLLLLSRTNETVENNRLYLALGKMKVLEFSLPSALEYARRSPRLPADNQGGFLAPISAFKMLCLRESSGIQPYLDPNKHHDAGPPLW